MQLKEIELDLPYEPDIDYIQKLQSEDGVSVENVHLKDYNENWKEKRIIFSRCTRCMTSMIERLCFPMKGAGFWKILIECVSKKNYNGYKNLLGVCVIQYQFDFIEFNNLTEIDKKKEIIKIVLNSILEIPELNDIYITINNCISSIEEQNYNNQWFWKKYAKYDKNIVNLKVVHNLNEVELHLMIRNKEEILKDIIIAKTIPDERAYSKYFGEIGWNNSNEAYLSTIDKEKYTISL